MIAIYHYLVSNHYLILALQNHKRFAFHSESLVHFHGGHLIRASCYEFEAAAHNLKSAAQLQ